MTVTVCVWVRWFYANVFWLRAYGLLPCRRALPCPLPLPNALHTGLPAHHLPTLLRCPAAARTLPRCLRWRTGPCTFLPCPAACATFSSLPVPACPCGLACLPACLPVHPTWFLHTGPLPATLIATFYLLTLPVPCPCHMPPPGTSVLPATHPLTPACLPACHLATCSVPYPSPFPPRCACLAQFMPFLPCTLPAMCPHLPHPMGGCHPLMPAFWDLPYCLAFGGACIPHCTHLHACALVPVPLPAPFSSLLPHCTLPSSALCALPALTPLPAPYPPLAVLYHRCGSPLLAYDSALYQLTVYCRLLVWFLPTYGCLPRHAAKPVTPAWIPRAATAWFTSVVTRLPAFIPGWCPRLPGGCTPPHAYRRGPFALQHTYAAP